MRHSVQGLRPYGPLGLPPGLCRNSMSSASLQHRGGIGYADDMPPPLLGARPIAVRRGPTEQLRGFTLIEVLVAIVLIAVVLPIALAAVSSAIRTAEQTRRHDVALRMAESRLARLVADGSWQTSASSGSSDLRDDGEDTAGYTWQLAVATWRDPNVHTLHLTVGWGQDGSAGSVAMDTLVIPASANP